MPEYLFLMVGFFIGIAASVVGIGGGGFIVPFLTLYFGMDVQEAIGTSIFTIFFTSVSSSLVYHKKNLIDPLLGATILFTSVIGAVFGAFSTSHVSSTLLSAFFGIFMIFPSLVMLSGKELGIRKKPITSFSIERKTESGNYSIDIPLVLLLGFFAGFLSGFFGIGGGILLVPLMLFIGVPTRISIATSLFVMVFTSLSGACTHFTLGNIDFTCAMPLIVGLLIGAQIGPRISVKIRTENLRRFFGIVLLYFCIKMILENF
ncbi:MAG: sulfite exporter TauE/SafE family protein [Candidatus Syntropharchaeia archaeon]